MMRLAISIAIFAILSAPLQLFVQAAAEHNNDPGSGSSGSGSTTITTTRIPSKSSSVSDADHPSLLLSPLVRNLRNVQQRTNENNNDNNNDTTTTTIYRVQYMVRYQLLQDRPCSGPPPILQIQCHGEGTTTKIEVLQTSDPSIVCISTNDDESSLLCNNTCTESSSSSSLASSTCDTVYWQSIGPSSLGPWGTIEFTCSSMDRHHLDATTTWLDSGNGVCGPATIARNWHILQMGVSCPSTAADALLLLSSSNNNTGNTINPYVLDDAYFECLPGYSSIPFADANEKNVYTCVSGAKCGNNLACEVDFDTLSITSQSSNFASTCFESTTSTTTVGQQTTPTPAPLPNIDNNSGSVSTFSARFEVAWGVLSDIGRTSNDTSSSFCGDSRQQLPSIQIQCEPASGTLVKFINSSFTSVNCTTDNSMNSSMICSADTNGYTTNTSRNRLPSLVYECSGPVVPQTRVELIHDSSSFYPCDKNNSNNNTVEEWNVTHVIQLMIYCRDEIGTYLSNTDLFVDCVGTSPHFGYMDEYGISFDENESSTTMVRYTCSESIHFPIGSSSIDQTVVVPLAMSTDFNWIQSPDSACYIVQNYTTTVTPSSSVAYPSMSPSLAHLRPTSVAPVATPIAAISPVDNGPGTARNDSNGGFWIGVVVGGAVLGIVASAIGAYCIIRRTLREQDIFKTYGGNNSSTSASSGDNNDPTMSSSGDHPTPTTLVNNNINVTERSNHPEYPSEINVQYPTTRQPQPQPQAATTSLHPTVLCVSRAVPRGDILRHQRPVVAAAAPVVVSPSVATYEVPSVDVQPLHSYHPASSSGRRADRTISGLDAAIPAIASSSVATYEVPSIDVQPLHSYPASSSGGRVDRTITGLGRFVGGGIIETAHVVAVPASTITPSIIEEDNTSSSFVSALTTPSTLQQLYQEHRLNPTRRLEPRQQHEYTMDTTSGGFIV